jgi:prephenate dehydrogenase
MNLSNIFVIGLGLLGGSISLAVRHYLPKANIVGYSHRSSTRHKARRLHVAHRIADDLCQGVGSADLF